MNESNPLGNGAGSCDAARMMMAGKIAVFACEGGCIFGAIARLAATRLAERNARYVATAYGKGFTEAGSPESEWLRASPRVVVIDGCQVRCCGAILKERVGERRVLHFNAFPFHREFIDKFEIDDVPEAERERVARLVAERILDMLLEDETTPGGRA